MAAKTASLFFFSDATARHLTKSWAEKLAAGGPLLWPRLALFYFRKKVLRLESISLKKHAWRTRRHLSVGFKCSQAAAIHHLNSLHRPPLELIHFECVHHKKSPPKATDERFIRILNKFQNGAKIIFFKKKSPRWDFMWLNETICWIII